MQNVLITTSGPPKDASIHDIRLKVQDLVIYIRSECGS